jgi:CRISPR-associated RAMP protein (TIGR02581 family)
MLKRLVNEARFALDIETTGPLLIKSGHATLTGPDMAPVETYRNGGSQVYIPGSSLKGVFRSHLERVIRTLRPDAVVVADPFERDDRPDQSCSAWFDQRKRSGESLDNATVYAESDPIARLFGSTSFIGRISIGDGYLFDSGQDTYVTERRLPTELRDGVGIDRLTGGQSHGALFNLSVISSSTMFRTNILLRNFECWQLGAMLLVVQDMQDELIRLGSGTSRGLGSVRGRVDTVNIHYLGRTPNRSDTEIWGLGRFLGENSPYGTYADDVLSLSLAPPEQQRGIRTVQQFTQDDLPGLIDCSIAEFVRRIDMYPVYKTRYGVT